MSDEELSDDEIRELAAFEELHPATTCNPHLGLEPVSLQQLAAEMAAAKAKAEKAARKPTPKKAA
jgi:hypothetical protein